MLPPRPWLLAAGLAGTALGAALLGTGLLELLHGRAAQRERDRCQAAVEVRVGAVALRQAPALERATWPHTVTLVTDAGTAVCAFDRAGGLKVSMP